MYSILSYGKQHSSKISYGDSINGGKNDFDYYNQESYINDYISTPRISPKINSNTGSSTDQNVILSWLDEINTSVQVWYYSWDLREMLRANQSDQIEWFLSNGGDMKDPPLVYKPFPILFECLFTDQDLTVSMDILLSHGFNIDYDLIDCYQIHATLLMFACACSNFPMVKYCVDHNADVNYINPDGETSLSAACSSDLIRYQMKDDYKIKDQYCKLSTDWNLSAAQEIVKYLLAQGANPHQTYKGHNCLIPASRNYDLIKIFLEFGLSPNLMLYANGPTLFYYMINCSQYIYYYQSLPSYHVIYLLYKFKADPNYQFNGKKIKETKAWQYYLQGQESYQAYNDKLLKTLETKVNHESIQSIHKN